MKKSFLSYTIVIMFLAFCSTSMAQNAVQQGTGTAITAVSGSLIIPNVTTNIIKAGPVQQVSKPGLNISRTQATNSVTGLTTKQQLGAKLINQIVPKMPPSANQNVNKGQKQPKCLADEVTNNFIQQQMKLDPTYQKKVAAQKQLVQQLKQGNGFAKKAVRTIPVVVHVVHNPSNSNNPTENVTDNAIFNMMNTLNEDFRRLNADASQTRAAFLADAADAEIEFCLASKDPSGVSTTGITRTVTTEVYFDNDTETNKMKSSGTGGADPWDGTKYLNIWICNISNYAGFGIAGYAYLPSPGMHGSSIDGLVLDFEIGVGGRTPTHEIGHYFNLNHTWGSNPPSCSKDDGFADTPNSGSEQYGCNYSLNTCGTTNGDQIENYMSYANCQNMFSTDQAAEMNAILSGVRSSLLSSDGCEPTAPPVADFTANLTTVVVGGTVTFTDLTAGLPDTWSWTFGGGGTPNTETVKNPVIQFNTIGTYDVTLTATNSLGSDTNTKTGYIDVIAVPPPPICGEPLVLWCEDFAGGFPTGWTPGQVGTDAWIYSTTGPQGLYSIGPIASTTANNGYMLFDSDLLCSGNQDAYFYTVPIDLSSYPNVTLEFEQYFRQWLSSTTFVSLSTNGTTWTDTVWVNTGFADNDLTPNPELITMDISAYVGGSSTAYIKFGYKSIGSGCDYAWMVDDIKVREIPPFDAAITGVYYMSEYTITPERHATPLLLQAVVENIGVNTVNNVELTVNVYNGTLSNNVFTGTSASLATLAPGADTALTVAGGYTPSDTGFYIAEYIVSISDSDGQTSNDTAYLSTIISDSTYARDNGGLIGGYWDGTGNPYIFGQTFGLETPDYVSSITSFPFFQSAGDTMKLVLYDMVGGLPNSMIGETDEYIFTPADTPGAVITLPINTGPLSLAADTFFVGISAYNTTGTTTIGYTSAIITPGTSFASSDGAAWEALGGDVVYQENFNVPTMPSNITLFDNDGLTPNAAVTPYGFDGTNATAWVTNSSAFAISTSYYTPAGTSDDWMITPAITLGANNTLYWYAIAFDPAYPDGYEVYISTTTPTIAGCMANAALFTIAAEDTLWTSRSVDLAALGYANQTVYIGFRNTATDMFILGVDEILVGTPGPTLGSSFRNPFILRPNFAQCNLTLNTSTTDATCGVCNGVAVVTPVGGFYPFTYTWNDPAAQTDSSATGLCQGSYQVLVTDNNGCVSTTGVSITDAAGMSVTTVSTTENCGDATGTATATATGGTSPYMYLWDDPGAQTNQTATGLSAGTYNVTVTGTGGCTSETDFFSAAVVSNVPPPTTAMAGADTTHCDVTTGTLAANAATVGTGLWTVTSGTATITTPSSPTSGVTGLGASTTFTWTISNGGCPVSTDDVVITVNEGAIGNAGADATACDGTPYTLSGSIGGSAGTSAWVTSGTGTFDNTTSPTATYTPSAADALAGTVSLAITTDDPDGAGPCTAATDTLVLTINANPSAVIGTSTNILCTGDSTGSATASVTGGTGPYSYIWSDPAFQTNITANGLLAGQVGVMVTDANGCQDTVSVVLTEPSTALSGTTGTVDASCGVADGAAYITASGGTGAYTYQWNDLLFQTTDTAFNVAAGPYNVTLTDNNNCTFIGNASVSDAGAPTAAISNIVHVSCFGANDGSATVTATGGAPPYSYDWSTGGTDTLEVNMPGGTHSATVTDNVGCASVVNVTINEPAAITISSEMSTDISCNGLTDGTITITASGGIGTLYFSVDNGATYPDSTGAFTGLGAGSYDVSVRDSNGCTTAGSTLTINEPAAIVISSETTTDATCNGANDGTITVVASGGTGTLNFSIDSGTTYANTTGIFTALSTGTYGVSVQDANGCTATGSTLTIAEPSAVSIDTESSTDILCNGGTDGTITVTTSGGVGTITYSIDGGTTYANTTGMFTGLSAGTYDVAVQDANGCTATGGTLTISEPTALTTSTNTIASSCGQADGEASVDVFGGTAPFGYLWDDAGSSTNAGITGLVSGTYNVTVTDSAGCTSTSIATVTDQSLDSSSTSVVQNATCNGDCDGSASVAVTGGTSPFTYLWDDPDAQVTATADSLCAGVHSVDVTDANGCVVTDSVTITEPTLLTTTVTTTTATSGSCDGTATATASGGTGSYNYAWDDPAAQTTATATGLCPGDASVTVTDGNGCTAVGTDSVGSVIGIVDIYEAASVNVYPNPHQGSFKVQYNLNSSEQVTISIYSKIGALLMRYELGSTESGVYSIDMAQNANGIYYIQVTTESEIIIKKVSLIK